MKSRLPLAALLLGMLALFPTPRTRAQNPVTPIVFMYTDATEETYLAPTRFLSVPLKHTPAAPNGVNLFPVKVWLNGTLLPVQPTRLWALGVVNGIPTIVGILPNTPPTDPIPAVIAGQVRITVEYWWSP